MTVPEGAPAPAQVAPAATLATAVTVSSSVDVDPSTQSRSRVTDESTPLGGGDAEILSAIDAGDARRALALCARSHAQAIGRLCMAMLGSRTDADDLLQDTLLTAHRSFDGFRRDGSVRAWLLGIARNKCLQWLEKTRRQGAHLRLVPAAAAPRQADELLVADERARQARAALEQIRPSERDALLLRYAGELSFKEVAELCGIDEPAARKRVSRALLRLRTIAAEGTDP